LMAVVLLGCPKKKPETTPPPDLDVVTEPVPEPAEVEPMPEPEPMEPEMTEDVLPSDLVELNRYIVERGLISDVFYDLDSADLSAEGRSALSNNAAFMRENPGIVFTIEGHCDERGTNEYNLALGQRRANAAKDYLASLGVNAGQMRTISYGEERPFCTETSEQCWSLNRRAHFVATGRM
jgi:peptidoglycan-associated lipoprotein